jgi:ABC-type histidine transport system ATPase subunit
MSRPEGVLVAAPQIDCGPALAGRTPLLSIRRLRKSFGLFEVLKGVDLDVRRQEVVGFIGSSGSGKSTLLRCINMLEVPTEGTIRLDDEMIGFEETSAGLRPIGNAALSRQRRQMAMVFQQFNLWPHKSVLENVIEGPIVVQKVPKAQARETGIALLRKVGMDRWMDAYPSRLSGGQQQRVAIARALALKPKIILFDEPTSALDPELVGEVLKVIRDLATEGMTMIIVTHEMAFAHQVCDTVVFLANGRVEDIGPPAHIFGTSANPRTRDFTRRYQERTNLVSGHPASGPSS